MAEQGLRGRYRWWWALGGVVCGWLAPVVAVFARFKFPIPGEPYHLEPWRQALMMAAFGPGIAVANCMPMHGGPWHAIVMFSSSILFWAALGYGIGRLYEWLRGQRR